MQKEDQGTQKAQVSGAERQVRCSCESGRVEKPAMSNVLQGEGGEDKSRQ